MLASGLLATQFTQVSWRAHRVAIGATLSKDSEELELIAAKKGERRIFFIYFFGELAILFVNEAMILLAKARRAIIACVGLVRRANRFNAAELEWWLAAFRYSRLGRADCLAPGTWRRFPLGGTKVCGQRSQGLR